MFAWIRQYSQCHKLIFRLFLIDMSWIGQGERKLGIDTRLIEYLDGGSALHLNLDEKLNTSGYLSLLNIAAKTGCNYFCINVKITICNANLYSLKFSGKEAD